MGDYRSQHYAAAQEAIAAVGRVQEIIAIGTDRTEEAMGAVIMAVGQTPFVESAVNAMNFTAEVKNRFDEIYRITEQITAELQRYAGGF